MRRRLTAALRRCPHAALTVALHDRVVVNAERTLATAFAIGILRALGVIH